MAYSTYAACVKNKKQEFVTQDLHVAVRNKMRDPVQHLSEDSLVDALDSEDTLVVLNVRQLCLHPSSTRSCKGHTAVIRHIVTDKLVACLLGRTTKTNQFLLGQPSWDDSLLNVEGLLERTGRKTLGRNDGHCNL